MTSDGEKTPDELTPPASSEPKSETQPEVPDNVPVIDKPGKRGGKSSTREWLETIVVALLVALVIRTFVVQVYLVEGESMEPTLHTNERLLVNKFVYRFGSPQPGDIVVLQDPGRPTRELIKRVIAVEGETVEVKKDTVYVNGQPLKEPYINTLFLKGESYEVQTVPPGYIYVMGDNRGRSFDSRALGPVPLEKVDGKAFFMFWPLDKFGHGPLGQDRAVNTSSSSK